MFYKEGCCSSTRKENIIIFLNPIIALFADSMAIVDSIFSMESKPKVALKLVSGCS